MEEYRRCSCVIGKEVRLIRQTGDSFGKAVGIDDDGGLLVTFSDGHTETLTGGEITLRVQEKQ
jgi:BirA family biotin operon repressor/biotin-[acetyl-CoA-carboxylase] ligase